MTRRSRHRFDDEIAWIENRRSRERASWSDSTAPDPIPPVTHVTWTDILIGGAAAAIIIAGVLLLAGFATAAAPVNYVRNEYDRRRGKRR